MASPLRLLWQHPDLSSTKIEHFRQFVNSKKCQNLASYDDLWKWSVDNLNDFWMLVWEFTKGKSLVNPSYAISPHESSRLYPPPSWFPEARLNIAQNIVESPYIDLSDNGRPILTGIREGDGEVEHVTIKQLRDRVGQLANALKHSGIGKLDPVACIGANSIDTFVILLATASIGAIFTCSSPEMGEQGILERFIQVRPKILFADDWVLYNGKRISCLEKAQTVAAELTRKADLKLTVVVPRFQGQQYRLADERLTTLATFTAGHSNILSFTPLEFCHPFIIVYSSGTTGAPKCMVHSQGGVLIKHKLEQILSMDMDASSVYLQYSSTNWFMHIYSVLGLLSGTRSVLYDGSPVKPTLAHFLQILGKEKVTHFGTSAHYLHLLEQGGISAKDVKGLDDLKVITSTGSILHESQYFWVYKTFGPVHLMSMSGGTDVAGAFVGGAPSIPVFAGWCQAPTLGMKVEVYDNDGRPINNSGGDGELVCTAPFPSQPVFFLSDEGGRKYRASYFEKFPGVWHQGDYIRMHPSTQGILFLGRSDGVLNPSGVRFGSAEIYNCLAVFEEIEDSLCVGRRRPSDRDETVLLFVKMKPGLKLSLSLREAIAAHIRKVLSPRHVPKVICETPDIPVTLTGKKTEIPVKRIVSGQKIQSGSAIANPESLNWYAQFAASDSGNGTNGAKL